MKMPSLLILMFLTGVVVGWYWCSRQLEGEREKSISEQREIREGLAADEVLRNIEIIKLLDSGQITNTYRALVRPIWGYLDGQREGSISVKTLEKRAFVNQELEVAAKKYPIISNAFHIDGPPP